jgi:hypothetical protein
MTFLKQIFDKNVMDHPGRKELWNIMLPWNRVLTSSMSIFQTSCEHVLVLTVCAWRAVYCT